MLEKERDPLVHESSEILKKLGIKAVLFDFDDTLIYTSELYTQFKAQYVQIVSAVTGIDSYALLKRIQELNDEEYLKMGVSSGRWNVVIDRLSQEYGGNAVFKSNIDILMQIYQTAPRLRAGAKNILGGLRESGFKIGLVTHASTDWTERKLHQTGLLDFFDAIEIADPNGFKTVEHWQKGINLLNVGNVECLVVGDNLKGDIIPANSLGTKTIWMPSPWSVYREGVVPEAVVQMSELSQFWDAVQKLQ